jgi:uroporphyrinogen decarboxylase
VIAAPIRTLADVEKLEVADPRGTVPYVFEILRRLRIEIAAEQVPLLGFAGAPFTLAAYLVEGKGSKDFGALKRMMYREPALLHALLERLTEMTVAYLNAQIEAGAQAVQLFDTWAGLLSAADYREWILPTHQAIARRLHRDAAPLIVYVNGGAHVLDAMIEAGADVLSLDWRVDFAEASRRIGKRASVQGNLDPCALAAEPARIAAWVRELRDAGRAARGHVLNLGHGCLPETPVEGVRAFTDAARNLA